MSDNKNPYAKATAAYGDTTKKAVADGRDLEAQTLLKAATKLESLQKRLQKGEAVSAVESGEVLEYNQKLWQFFVNAMKNEDHPLPREIKNNIATLGLFVFKRTLEIMIDTKPDKIQALVEINRNIAAGLMTRPKEGPKPAAPETAKAKPATPPAHPPGHTYARQEPAQKDKDRKSSTTDSVV